MAHFPTFFPRLVNKYQGGLKSLKCFIPLVRLAAGASCPTDGLLHPSGQDSIIHERRELEFVFVLVQLKAS